MELFDSDLQPCKPLLSELEPSRNITQNKITNALPGAVGRTQDDALFLSETTGRSRPGDTTSRLEENSKSETSDLSALPQESAECEPGVSKSSPQSSHQKTDAERLDLTEYVDDNQAQPSDVQATPDGVGLPSHDHDHDNGNGNTPTPTDFDTNEEFEQGFWPVLKNWNFLVLWSGQVFSQLADKVYLVLMIGLIASRFQAEGQTISGWVSALMIVFTIPAVLFGSIAGVFVDRWPKKLVLVSTNLLRGVLVLALPPLLWISQGWAPFAGLPVGFFMLLAVTFWVSTLTQFFAPAEQAAIPLLVKRKHLLSANSLYTTTMMASVIIGFALGEPLLAIANTVMEKLGTAVGIGQELLVGLGYGIAGMLLLFVRPQEKGTHLDKEHAHVFQDIRDGLKYLGQQGRVRAALVQLVILFSIFAALAVLAVRLAEIMPAIDSDQFGFLLAAAGVGMAIGAALIGQFCQRFSRNQLSLLGSIGISVCLISLSFFTERLFPALGCIMLMGSFAALVGIPMQTTIQAETPEAMRGKVFGLQNNAVNIALSLPLALAGVAENFVGLQAVFLGLAALAISGGVVTWYISRKGTAKTAS
ncbi:MAG TPA: MFS transporter [Elainellaceae cyanobacterium]